jgi:CRP-like cAMP-binding protein
MNVMVKDHWTKADVLAFLAKGRWFGSLPAPLQDTIIAESDILPVRANSILYKIGDDVDGLYATLDGDVRAYAYGDENERIFLRALGPGSWFGDVHLVDNYSKRTFEVRCISSSTLIFLPTRAYRKITEADPAAYKAFVQLMCIHMRHTVQVLVEARSEAPRRSARALMRLARAHGVSTGSGVRLQMNLSQADLASLVGVSRQYMNELIARWEEDGLLRWNGKAQPVLNIERLRSLLSSLDTWIEDTEDWV